ncbi:MAG TPA: hypothetical protein VEQ63_00485 [Bryobacteraceae bacterium]|nr:hypothetical protein [Bryobacteraceae bacterium]
MQLVSRRSALVGFAGIPFFPSKPSILGTSFRVIRNETDRRRYLWIHGDEKTAAAVLEEHMKQARGVAFLVQNGERNIAVNGGKLDPNRMFSRVGAERNLRMLNPSWTTQQTTQVLDKLDGERRVFLKRILPPVGALLVALHNNTPGAYTVNDEAKISDAVALNDKEHPDEFMLCTDTADFGVLANSRHNVVLQNKVPPEDDGSLSRLCAARGVRYVNIEATHGNAEVQRKMLAWLEIALQ